MRAFHLSIVNRQSSINFGDQLVDHRKKVIEAISEIGKSRIGLSALERQLETAGKTWLENTAQSIPDELDEFALDGFITELSSVVESLRAVSGVPSVNTFLGNILSLLVDFERRIPRSRKIMKRLLNPQTSNVAERERKRLLVISTSLNSTKVACFEGIEIVCSSELHLSPDAADTIGIRIESVVSWLSEIGMDISSIDGIACRGGYVQPVPTGTYPKCSRILNSRG